MDNDMLCTQAMPDIWDEDSDSVLHDDTINSRRKIGVLKVLLKEKCTTQSEFSIFRGQNIIGRHSTCDISIPWSTAMSKRHAIIEVEDETCFLSDCGSSNKTRFGRVQLRPNIKYGLRDGDEITFGDVKCVFHELQEKDEITPANCTTEVLAMDTPDFVFDERFPSMAVPDSPCEQDEIRQPQDTNVPPSHDNEAATEDGHANETDVTHISDSNGNYHMDSDTDLEDNKADDDADCMSEDDIYQASTLPLDQKSTSQNTESSQYDEELDDENDDEMSMIADLASEQTQKLHPTQAMSEDPQIQDSVASAVSTSEKDPGNFKNEVRSQNIDVTRRPKVEQHEDDAPGCSGINQNPVANLLNDPYEDDSFGDLTTQPFVMPKKSAFCEDTLGLLETQAMILPSSTEDEINISDSLLEDMPTQAFPINVTDSDDDTERKGDVSELKNEIAVPETVHSPTPVQDSSSMNEDESSADLSGAKHEKQNLLPIDREQQYASDATSMTNTDSAASVQWIGKSDEEVGTDTKTSHENGTASLANKRKEAVCESSLENNDTLPLVSHAEDNSTEIKSGLGIKFSNRVTFAGEESCDDDTQPLLNKDCGPSDKPPRGDDAPCLPKTKDVMVPLENYSDISTNNCSLKDSGDEEGSTELDPLVSRAEQNENVDNSLCARHRSELSVVKKDDDEQSVQCANTSDARDDNAREQIRYLGATNEFEKSVEIHCISASLLKSQVTSSVGEKKQNQPSTNNGKEFTNVNREILSHDASNHGSVLVPERENEFSDNDATQEYDTTFIEETTIGISDASAIKDNGENATVETQRTNEQSTKDNIGIPREEQQSDGDDDEETQAYDMISVEETPSVIASDSAQEDNNKMSMVENPPLVHQKVEKEKEVEVFQNHQKPAANDDDATTQEYHVNSIEEASTEVDHDTTQGNEATSVSRDGQESGTHDLSCQTTETVPSSTEGATLDSAEVRSLPAKMQEATGVVMDENGNIVKSDSSSTTTVSSEIGMVRSPEGQPSTNSNDFNNSSDATQPYSKLDKSTNLICDPPLSKALAVTTAQDTKSCIENSDMLSGDINASITVSESAIDLPATQAFVKPTLVRTTPRVVATCSVTVRKEKQTERSLAAKYSLRRKDNPSSHVNVSNVSETQASIKEPEKQVSTSISSPVIDNHHKNTVKYSLRGKDNPTSSGDTLESLQFMQTQSFVKDSEQLMTKPTPTALPNIGHSSGSDVSTTVETQSFIKHPEPQGAGRVHVATQGSHKGATTSCSVRSVNTLPFCAGDSDSSAVMETQSFIKHPKPQIVASVVNVPPTENVDQISSSISNPSTIHTRSRRSARKDYAKLANGEPLPGGRKRSSKSEVEKESPKRRSVRSQKMSSLGGNSSPVQTSTLSAGSTTSKRSTRSKTSIVGMKQNARSHTSTNQVTLDTSSEVAEDVTKAQTGKHKRSTAIDTKSANIHTTCSTHSNRNTVSNPSKKTKTLPKRSLRSGTAKIIAQEDEEEPTTSKDPADNDVYDFDSSSELSVALMKGPQPVEEEVAESDLSNSVPSASTARRRATKRRAAKKNSAKPQSSNSPVNSNGASADDTCVTADLSVNSADNARKRRGISSNPPTAKRKKSNQPDQISRNRPKRVAAHKPKVMFTGIMDGFAEGIVTNLGGKLAADINESTHLVTDKMRRTIKFLCAVSMGMHIVTPQWLHKSNESKRFLPEEEFYLTDDVQTLDGEELQLKYNFNLQNTLQMVRESENRLFHNLTIFVTKNVAPNPHQMKQILESAGATVLTKMPRFNKDTDTDLVIVSTLDDERSLSNAIKSGCRIVSNEFVLTGILRHQIDFTSFNLFHTESEITQSPTVQSSNSGTSTKRRRTRKK